MVFGLAAVWERATFGIWDGAGADGGVDLRDRAYSGGDTVSTDDLSGLPLGVERVGATSGKRTDKIHLTNDVR